jgi:hypothetical protein
MLLRIWLYSLQCTVHPGHMGAYRGISTRNGSICHPESKSESFQGSPILFEIPTEIVGLTIAVLAVLLQE